MPLRRFKPFTGQMEYHFPAVLQSRWGPPVGYNGRGPHEKFHEPHAVHRTGGYGQEGQTHRLWG